MFVFPYIFYYIVVIIQGYLAQTLKPKYHNSTIIHGGDQIHSTINPHEIFVLQIDTSEQRLHLLFRADDKKALYYLYRTADIEELLITESELVRLLTYSEINQPLFINGYSFYSDTLKSPNILSNKNQAVILLYCPFDVSCTYFISCIIEKYENNFNMHLIDNQSFIFSTSEVLGWILKLPGKDSTPITFYFNATSYTGLIDLNSIMINQRAITTYNRRFIGNQEMIWFTTPANAEIIIVQQTLRDSVVFYQYRFSEQTINEINIETDIAKIYSIDMNSKKQLSLYKSTFYDNVPIVVNIKSDNCELKIENLNLDQYSIEANYYQIFFNNPNDYSFRIASYS